MADEFFSTTPPPASAPTRRGAGTRAVLGTALLAFLLGGGAVGYAVWQGLIPLHLSGARSPAVLPAVSAPLPAPAAPRAEPAALASQQASLEARVAALSQRLDSLDLRATAASGNAGRAEALLVAFAVRRALDRGAQLGLLEDQLRLRFGDAQPHAVSAVIDAAREPVTLDQLVAGLDALAPTLTEQPAEDGAWLRIRHAVAGLFVIRRESAPSPAPVAVLRRAHLLLEQGRTEDAMSEVRRLPGARDAGQWLGAARRYEDARRALDVLETAALIDTRGLRDTVGTAITTPPPGGA